MPSIASTFKSGEPSLPDLLKDVHSGKIQLPDFQRSWVWDDDHIRSLIASVSQSYPIGAVMLLQTGGDGAQFQPRLLQGVDPTIDVKPEYLILDGQQRMTSLYLALFCLNPVPTQTVKHQDIDRFYYLDISKCLDTKEDRLDAVIAMPSQRKITSDFGRKVDVDASTEEKEYELGLFPLNIIYDSTAYATWRRGFQKLFRNDESKLDMYDNFESEVINRFQVYRVPTIELLRGTPKEAVCQVFEKVNTGGVTLTVFELMTAIFAGDNYNLRTDWEDRKVRLKNHAVLDDLDATAFLTAVTLLSTYQKSITVPDSAVTCKRKDVLKLTLDDFKTYAPNLEAGMIKAARFLMREKIFDVKTLPYSTQLIPMAAICSVLGDRFENDSTRQRIAQWFWCGVFGELYGGANESRYAFDLPEFIKWVEGGDQPRSIRDSNFSPNRLLSMQSRLSSAYKGLMALLMKEGSHDFISGDSIEIASYFDMAIDIHHIFPADYCQGRNYKRQLWNSSVNKAPLSAKTNRIIGRDAPSVYLSRIERNHGLNTDRLNTVLKTHQIDPGLLRQDAFEIFIRDRASRLLDLIERATGKTITGRDSDEVIKEYGASLIFNQQKEPGNQ